MLKALWRKFQNSSCSCLWQRQTLLVSFCRVLWSYRDDFQIKPSEAEEVPHGHVVGVSRASQGAVD